MAITFICKDCGYKVEDEICLIYRKNGKIIETEYLDLPLLYEEYNQSYLKGVVHYSYCEDCNKIIKIYSLDKSLNNSDIENNIKVIKKYMEKKASKNTVKTFIKYSNSDYIECPICNKKIIRGILLKKCIECGSKNLEVIEIDY